MKKIKVLLLFMIVFLCNMAMVSAADKGTHNYSYNHGQDITGDKKNWIQLCGWVENFELNTGQWIDKKYVPDKAITATYVYYNVSTKKYHIAWYDSKDKKSSASNFSDQKIFYEDGVIDSLLTNGVCPKHAFVDEENTNEVCFANDTTYCRGGDPGGAGTNFKGTVVDRYNYVDDLKTHTSIHGNPPDDCDELLLGNTNYEEQINIAFKDGIKDWINGKNIPSFMTNPLSQLVTEKKKLWENKATQCKAEVDKDLEDGKISQDQADSLKNDYDKFNENLGEEFDNVGEYLENLGDIDKGTQVSGCEVIPEVVRKWINNILKFVRYVALALVIALGALDFMKAAGSGEADAMKKAGQSFMKRMIAVVILFLLPVIVDFILNMINIYGIDKDNIDCL